MSNDNLAAESVASKILAMVAEVDLRDTTLVTPESVLGRDLGFDELDALDLVLEIEDCFEVDLHEPPFEVLERPPFDEDGEGDCLLGLTVQAVIDATMKALAEKPPVLVPGSTVTLGGVEFEVSEESTVTASIPVENIKPALLAPKLTPEDIEGVIVSEHYFTAADGVMHARREEGFVADPLGGLPNVTFCLLILRNGTKVTGVNHGPVSNANFRAVEGRRRARANAIEKVWELEGYLLRERLANPTHITLNHLTAEQEADLVEALRNSPPGSLEVLADQDADIIRFTNGDDGVFAHVTAPSGKHYGINLEHMACDADDELNLVGKFFRAVVDRVKAGAQLTDSDSAKGAQLLAIVREFVEKHRIYFPEVIHQTDRVIENAYGLIQDLVDVAGYLPEEDEA